MSVGKPMDEVERVARAMQVCANIQLGEAWVHGEDADDFGWQHRAAEATAAIAALRAEPDPRDAVVEALRIFLNDRSQVAQLEEALAAHDLIQPPDPTYIVMLRAQALLDAEDVPYAIRRLKKALAALDRAQEPKG